MNKAELEREYKTENGVIVSPGKFQGEALYVPYLWYMPTVDDEFYDADTDASYNVYYPDDEDRKEFPALSGVCAVILVENDQGFVSSTLFSTQESVEQFRAVVEGSNSAEGGQ